MTGSYDPSYIDIVHKLKAIGQLINVAYCINTITGWPCPRSPTSQYYLKELVAHVKSLDPTYKDCSTRMNYLIFVKRHYVVL